MNIHEFQGKEIFRRYGVAVPNGFVAKSPDEAADAAKKLGTPVVVLKSQIHAGGRGKGTVYSSQDRSKVVIQGGVKVVKPELAKETAEKLLGNILVTIQTGPEGKPVNTLLVEEGMTIVRELYVAVMMDRSKSKDLIMVSTEGGMEIEEVAHHSPEKIVREYVDPRVGLQPFQARKLAYALGLEGDAFKNGVRFISALYKAFKEMDCSIAEINPLIVTNDNRVLALDAKLNFDDNALYRHEDVVAMRDVAEEDPLEVEASKSNLNYVKLDGNVGCMVNGAGLAMATMDIIKLAGGEPANFLDVGGGANVNTVRNGFRIILSDPNVKAILINIFGGIVRCDRVANGVIEAARSMEINVPIIVRLAGTNAEEAREILAKSGLNLIPAEGLKDAAQKVTQAIS
ncbi:MAG: ADP-forming succinate--CoA ligase subunit beta [Bacteroidetes bacterium]|nr:ADP-forming succinate--CoA ligase subunit beta [Bacteroidota bacterium]